MPGIHGACVRTVGTDSAGRHAIIGNGGSARNRQPPMASRARVNTSSSIGSVSLPVKVFC